MQFHVALEVSADTFRQQLLVAPEIMGPYHDKKIVMYRTGGICCEKVSAWMRHNGFKQVYHIEGGIIEYVRKAREQGLPIWFIGKNFVFDRRIGGAFRRILSSNVINLGLRATPTLAIKITTATYCLSRVRSAQNNLTADAVRAASRCLKTQRILRAGRENNI